MDIQSLKEVQDFFSEDLYEDNNNLLEAAGMSQGDVDELIAQAIQIDGKPIDVKDVEKLRKGETDLNEALGQATIIAAPVLIKLAGKAADRIKQRNLKGADKKEFTDLLEKSLTLKKEFQKLKTTFKSFGPLSKQKPGPNTRPEYVEAYNRYKETAKNLNIKQREYQDINKEIDSKFGAFKTKGLKVGFRGKELVIIRPGNAITKFGKMLHNIYASPLTAVVYGMSLAAPKGSKLKDKKFREKVVNIVYAAAMTYVAGKGIIEALSHLSGVQDIAAAAIESLEENASIAEITNSYLESSGVQAELNKLD